jgi:dienelactone hydrolase
METDETATDAPAQPQPTIDVPATVRRDERFTPRITGLDPGCTVELAVSASDEDGEWRSRATYTATDDGVVDLGTHAPDVGSYADRPTADPDSPTVERTPADPMGLVWSLAPADGGARPFQWTPTGSHDLQWTARPTDEAPDGVVDADSVDDVDGSHGGDDPAWSVTATTTVRHCDPDVTRHAPDDGHPDAYYEPAGDGPHPAVVVLHGSGGTDVEATASLLASHGFAAFACRWLDTDDLPEAPRAVPLERVADAIDWFRARDAVVDDAYGIWGVSMGSQLALHLAVRDDDVDAVVADSGGHVRYFGGGTGSWAEDGDVLPYVDRRAGPPTTFQSEIDGSLVGSGLFTQMLEDADAEERDAATIPFEAADADLLWLSGSDDVHWPATMFGNMLLARLDAVGYDHDYEHDVYHDAGHGIGVANDPTTWRPSRETVQFAYGGTPEDAASAAATAWQRVLDRFEQSLDDPR